MRVQQYAHDEGLWQGGAHLLVAVSGGPDSVVMLDILAKLAAGTPLTVAHVNHGLRAEAELDAAFVAEIAQQYRLPFLQRRVDVRRRIADTGETVEEAARVMRYGALQDMAREAGAREIATGHNADDQAETVLMRMLRGTGLTGLAGIPPRRGNIIRPLLSVWRREIMDYIEQQGLAYRTDLTNFSFDMTRNRLRNELLPLLEQEYAPRLRVRLEHLAELARQDGCALEAWTEREFARLRTWMPDGLALPPALELPHAIRWRLWRRAIAEVRGTLEDITFDHLDDIARLSTGQQAHLPGVLVIHEAGHHVFLRLPAVEAGPVYIPEQPLPVPGRTCASAPGICLNTAYFTTPIAIESGDVAVMNPDVLQGALTVRSWQPGDRFRPLGAPGERKLQDIFVDAGVPRRLRTRVPVVLDEKGIVWLAGFRIADRVKMTPVTQHSLRISVEWELNPWTLKPSDVA